MNRAKTLVVALAAVLLSACPGCSPTTKATVSGRITLAGKPLENVRVGFGPDSGPGAMGITDTDGRYTAIAGPRDGKWLAPGRAAVDFSDLEAESRAGQARFPGRYLRANTSGFTVELKPGPNVCDFDLEAK